MSGAKNKAKDRQSRKNATYYTQQKDKTEINKVIRQARHIALYQDRKALDRLKQANPIIRSRAAKIAKSGYVRGVLTNCL